MGMRDRARPSLDKSGHADGRLKAIVVGPRTGGRGAGAVAASGSPGHGGGCQCRCVRRGAFQESWHLRRGNHAERTPSEVEAAVEARLPYRGRSFDCARLRLAPLPGLRLGQAGCSSAHEIGMHPRSSACVHSSPGGPYRVVGRIERVSCARVLRRRLPCPPLPPQATERHREAAPRALIPSS